MKLLWPHRTNSFWANSSGLQFSIALLQHCIFKNGNSGTQSTPWFQWTESNSSSHGHLTIITITSEATVSFIEHLLLIRHYTSAFTHIGPILMPTLQFKLLSYSNIKQSWNSDSKVTCQDKICHTLVSNYNSLTLHFMLLLIYYVIKCVCVCVYMYSYHSLSTYNMICAILLFYHSNQMKQVVFSLLCRCENCKSKRSIYLAEDT